MTLFELARLPRVALMGEYLRTLDRSDRMELARVANMTREALVAAIMGDPDGGRRLRAMAAAERHLQVALGKLRDQRHAA